MIKQLRFLLVLALLSVIGQASAQTIVTFTAGTDNGKNTGNGKADQISKDGVTIYCSDAAFNAYNKGTESYEYRFYKNSTTTISSTVGNIQKIVFTCTAEGEAKQGPGCFEQPSSGSYSYEGKIGTWTGNSSSVEFSSPSNQVRATKIEVTLVAGSSTKQSAGLEFSATSATAVLGQPFTAPTLSNPNQLPVTYTSSDENVATVAEDGTVTIKAAGTTMITASSEETDEFYAGSASYSLNVASAVDNIAAFKGIGIGNSAILNLTNAQVLYVYNNDMYVRDASGAIDFYKSNLEYKPNQILNGTLSAKYAEFNGLPEVTDVADVNVTASEGTAAADPLELTTDQLTAEHYCDLVKIEGTYDASASTLDGVALYDKFQTGELDNLADGGRGSVTGILVPFHDAPEIYVISAEELASTKKNADLAFSQDSVSVVLGEEFTAPTLSNPNNLPVTYSSSDENVATVDAQGNVTVVGAGTTKITASSEETDTYYAGSASYTLVVEKLYTSIADFKTIGKKNTAKLKLNDAQVVYVNNYTTNSGKQNSEIYVRDASGAIEFFNTGVEFTVGQILNGTLTATYDEFNSLPEITKVANVEITTTDGTVEPRQVASPADLSAADFCDLVEVSGVYSAEAKTLGGVPVYDKFKNGSLDNLEDGVNYTVTAVVVSFKNAPELALVSSVATGINNVEAKEAGNGSAFYNLAGQCVDANYKGIVICNGKKMLKK